MEATRKITVGPPLLIRIPHSVEALLNCHHAQQFCHQPQSLRRHFFNCSSHKLWHYDIITLYCNNINSAALLRPSLTQSLSTGWQSWSDCSWWSTENSTVVKNPPANAGDSDAIPSSGQVPCRKKRQPTPVFLPGKSHGQRSLVAHSPRGLKSVRNDWAHTQLPDNAVFSWFTGVLT